MRIQRKKSRKIAVIAFAGALFAALIILSLPFLHQKEVRPAAVHVPLPSAEAPAAVPLVEYKERLRPGDTVGSLLSNYGLDPKRIYLLYEEVKPVYDLRLIKAGQEFRVYANEEGQVVRLEYDVDETKYLTIWREGEKFIPSLGTHPVQTEVNFLGGTIEDNPILAFNKLGEGDMLALAFSDLFAWDVDFYTDLRRGDSFKVIFEKRFRQGKFIGYGSILAAELINRGRKFQAFRYLLPGTQKVGYYDAEGKSLQKQFIKSPIKWARITSRFSRRRLHPIHHFYRAHYGVDYAAPIGTPVQATADGTVIYVGANGASGRMVKIRHPNAYETMYLHLKNYGPGIRVGARVKTGDIVGYVGSSGESTGPHLDYRITLRGSYINPLSWKFEPIEPLPEDFTADFGRTIEPYRLLLEDPFLLCRLRIF